MLKQTYLYIWDVHFFTQCDVKKKGNGHILVFSIVLLSHIFMKILLWNTEINKALSSRCKNQQLENLEQGKHLTNVVTTQFQAQQHTYTWARELIKRS